MRSGEIDQLCDREFDYPVDSDVLIEEFGETELAPPTGESTTVADVLSDAGETTYHSAEDIHATIMGNLDDAFVGRKFYDDRGGVWDFDQRDRTHSF